MGFYNRYLTLYIPVVTICTTSLTFTNSTFCPHSVFMCFVWIWEQTAIISLYSINWLGFITETQSVYCAVRTGCLHKFQLYNVHYALSVCPLSQHRPIHLSELGTPHFSRQATDSTSRNWVIRLQMTWPSCPHAFNKQTNSKWINVVCWMTYSCDSYCYK